MGIRHYDYPSVKSIVICGDIHGEFEKMVYQICMRYKMCDTLIIVAGDCGFGFKYPAYYIDLYFSSSMTRLMDANNYIAFVRGNHDNPWYFDGEQVGYEHFRAVPDYSVLTACGHQILCVGGAVSIDRYQRTQGKDWWADESPVFMPETLSAIRREGYHIDTVVTHTAPSFCEFTMVPRIVDSERLLDDMQHERLVMDSILAMLAIGDHPLRHWFYGHFHHSWYAEIDGVQYTMLNIMEMKELR